MHAGRGDLVSSHRARLTSVLILAAFVTWAAPVMAGQAAPASRQRRVLVLQEPRPDAPVAVLMEAIYRAAFEKAFGSNLDYYSEYLDSYRLDHGGADHDFREYLALRYNRLRPDVLIATTSTMLRIVAGGGDGFFPGVPVVFSSSLDVPRRPDTTGVFATFDLAPALRMALSLQPETRRVIAVSGTTDLDRSYVDAARTQFKAFEGTVDISYSDHQSVAELERMVSKLTAGTIVFYLVITRDGAGQPFLPVVAVERLSAASSVPVYSWHEGLLGHGIVGGRLFSSRITTEETAALAVRVLRGERADSIPVRRIEPYVTVFDWRQLQRWHIAESSLPPGSVVLFRPESVWQQHGREIAVAAAALAIVCVLAGALWIERRRRSHAERDASRYLAGMADLDRRATIGRLTASLAHELRQPLSAILLNSEAAQRLLESETPSLAQLQEIVDDIHSADRRATDIVQRVRGLLQNHRMETAVIDVRAVVREAMGLVEEQAASRHVSLDADVPDTPLTVRGDIVHLQQALLNVLLNGVDATEGNGRDDRRLHVAVAPAGSSIEIAVRDGGQGIPRDALDRIFEPFYTTKTDGLGMGLFIARSIVEAHEGTIAAENRPEGGAIVRMTLPMTR
jgi:signal transduction histidine kinase